MCLRSSIIARAVVSVSTEFAFGFSFRVGFWGLLFRLFFRVYCRVELLCVCNLTRWLVVTEGMISKGRALIQFNQNGARFLYTYLHINYGSVNIGSVGSVGSVCFRVRINLGRISVYYPLLNYQDTTLTLSTTLTICQVFQLSQRYTGGNIDHDSAWFFGLSFFVNLVFICIWRIFRFFSVTFTALAFFILSCVTIPPP